ncbi:hypothetical protein CFL01nite_15210 [Corynebacterium flavescens]|uniref:Uncharacterized protein n=1 Tax=Corynebacterium flavescens TaxID=28028 RepID=A0AB73B8C6_CORFL|nr:hypothetical protein CFL01nite_15210 [Corynebacterium flavescens]
MLSGTALAGTDDSPYFKVPSSRLVCVDARSLFVHALKNETESENAAMAATVFTAAAFRIGSCLGTK